jgi:hypothetical protein
MTTIYNRPGGKNRFQIASASERPLFSAWLDEEFNAVYKEINGLVISPTVSASEWTAIPGTYTQLNSTSFTVAGDKSDVFEAMRAIQFNGEYHSHIQSASYNSGTGVTTVVVYDSVVPATIETVSVGIVGSESATIPSTNIVTKSANYTVSVEDKIILCDDSQAMSGGMVYDDGYIGNTGTGYYALLITLPQPAALPKKLFCVKKVAGTYRTIVSAHFTHSTSQNADNETVHTNTYDFTIKGDTTEKNRVELKGIGDCYWFASDGNNWYEVTPESSETVKGTIRLATDSEMTLTAQQIADDEDLRKDLAVSPFNLDAHYLRTDASNMRFASNYIYKFNNPYNDVSRVAGIVNGNVVVYAGLGINIPTGRDTEGVITTRKFELENSLTLATGYEVSAKLQLVFIGLDENDNPFLQPILAENYHVSYGKPSVINTQTGDKIIWFDLTENLLKLSTDNGTNWTDFVGSGPVCEFHGNGSAISNITPYSCVGFLTRDELQNIYQTAVNNMGPDYSAGITKTKSTSYTAEVAGILFLNLRIYGNDTGTFTLDGNTYNIPKGVGGSYASANGTMAQFYIPKGSTYRVDGEFTDNEIIIFYPLRGANL